MPIATSKFEKKVSAELGKTVRAVRLSKNVTQDQLAERIGVHRITVVNYESGRKTISLGRVTQIAHALSICASDLVGCLDGMVPPGQRRL
jgi:DNA-binding XRE family transcriptional regulator